MRRGLYRLCFVPFFADTVVIEILVVVNTNIYGIKVRTMGLDDIRGHTLQYSRCRYTDSESCQRNSLLASRTS
ncbi:hypothetical protein BDV23DRAFT_165356 [Aspergillus alliaceus]|uniref:Uncharacterized protein n=1 Tax=Petromyces alliaceus TaxID=209559 RepID=A0A5N7BUF3_PETAA|nr:hypothetical protein BDV23DRAFT_165356 [Aspergillus alliaceus]